MTPSTAGVREYLPGLYNVLNVTDECIFGPQIHYKNM